MSNSRDIEFQDGIIFTISSFGTTRSNAEVAVPVEATDRLSDEEIGARVRALVEGAVQLNAKEVLSGWDNYRRYPYSQDGMDYYTEHLSFFRKYAGSSIEVDSAIAKLEEEIQNRERREREKIKREQPKPAKEGFVYLAYAETGHYKIGISIGPIERIRVFDTQMPISVTLVHTFRCDNARRAETFLHVRYESKWHTGEWFNLSEKDVEAIKQIVSFEGGNFVYREEWGA